MALLPVSEALARVLAAAPEPMRAETVPIARGWGRTLASPLAATRTQPPFDASAMDGYALRAGDLQNGPATLDVIGESAAGRSFPGRLGPGEAVRIFTGAPIPEGADTVVIQENAARDGNRVRIEKAEPRRHIRRTGLDFREGETLLAAGTRLNALSLALAGAMGHGQVPVRARPRVALIATGDELVRPGEVAGPDQIVASNALAVAAILEKAGAEALDLGIARDTREDLAAALREAEDRGADIVVTLGGASVGEHDLVQAALTESGLALEFWKIAMRPGKPLMFGRLRRMLALGLPGNPVSAIVCAILFGVPLVRRLLGDPTAGSDPSEAALLGTALAANDDRADYRRARLEPAPEGLPRVFVHSAQDSSMLKLLAGSGALIVRAPNEPAAEAGAPCRIIKLAPFV